MSHCLIVNIHIEIFILDAIIHFFLVNVEMKYKLEVNVRE